MARKVVKETNKSTSARDHLRSLTVGSPKTFKKEIVEFGGESFDVRQPSIKALRQVAQAAEDKDGTTGLIDLGIWAMIFCTYVPDTNQLVFDESDHKEIMSHPKSPFIELLTSKSIEMITIDVEGMEKN